MQLLSTVDPQIGYLLDIRGEVVETFGAHEEAFGHLRCPRETKGLREIRPVREGRPVMIAIATLGIESAALGERFEQRRLSGSVLADEKGDVGANRQIDALRQRRDIERMSSRVPFIRKTDNTTEERCARA